MYMCYLYTLPMTFVWSYVCHMRRPQMGRRSAGLSRATPSIHMLTLNPSCYLSVCLCLSPLLSHIAHMAGRLDEAPVVLIICPLVPLLESGPVFASHIGT